MGCGCGSKAARAQPVQQKQQQATSLVSNNLKRCPKCQATMIYKQQFVTKLKGYIKIWECPNKPCNYKIVGR
jgi:hypothetical protein